MKKNNKNFYITLITNSIILALFLLTSWSIFTTLEQISIGLHNADTGQNMRYITAKTGLTIKDTTLTEQNMTGEQLYITGSNQIIKGIPTLIASTFLAGILFVWLLSTTMQLGKYLK